MFATAQPVVTFSLTADDVLSYGMEHDPFHAAILEISNRVEGWDWYDVDRWDRIGDLVQYWGSLYRGPLDVPSSSVEAYRFYVEITPCLVTVEVYQAEQA